MIAATILPALLFITAVYLMRKWINLSEVLILMFLSEFILSFAYWIGVKINLRSSTKEISI